MNESRATRYQRLKRRTRAAGLVSAELVLALIALTPAAHVLADWAARFAQGLSGVPFAAVSLAAFVILLVAVWELAALPATYVAIRVDGAYRQGAALPIEDVLRTQIQAAAVALPAALVTGAVLLTSMALAGRWWWALAGFTLAVGLAGALGVGPALFGALADVRPLGRADLADRLAELARVAHVPVAGIDVWLVGESDRTSALVTGIGPWRRVLLSPDLARRWSDDEVAVVVAHELAHHAYGDLWRRLALDAAILSGGLFVADVVVGLAGPALRFAGPADLSAWPAIALVVSAVWLFVTPLRHAQSRRHERRADVFALTLTGSADAFGAAVRRLGARHLAEERPSAMTRWLYDTHPSVGERLALADAYRQSAPPTSSRAAGRPATATSPGRR